MYGIILLTTKKFKKMVRGSPWFFILFYQMIINRRMSLPWCRITRWSRWCSCRIRGTYGRRVILILNLSPILEPVANKQMGRNTCLSTCSSSPSLFEHAYLLNPRSNRSRVCTIRFRMVILVYFYLLVATIMFGFGPTQWCPPIKKIKSRPKYVSRFIRPFWVHFCHF